MVDDGGHATVKSILMACHCTDESRGWHQRRFQLSIPHKSNFSMDSSSTPIQGDVTLVQKSGCLSFREATDMYHASVLNSSLR